MTFTDDDLTHLAAHGVPPLPKSADTGTVANDGALIWYATWGDGPPVLLLHGGLGNAGNWGHQVPALIEAGYRVVAIDSRGQGHSTCDERPYSYQLMAGDTRTVMDHLGIARAAIVGWSDGADIGLVMAHDTPERVSGLFFFACNVDATGTLPFEMTPTIERIYPHHVADYAKLSPAPENFERMRDDLGVMQRDQPNYAAADLAQIRCPVWAVLGAHDEFIRPAHMAYIAANIPGATLHILPEVSHFAPLQRPAAFNAELLKFLGDVAHHPN